MLVCGDSLDPARRTPGTGGCGRGITGAPRVTVNGTLLAVAVFLPTALVLP